MSWTTLPTGAKACSLRPPGLMTCWSSTAAAELVAPERVACVALLDQRDAQLQQALQRRIVQRRQGTDGVAAVDQGPDQPELAERGPRDAVTADR